MIAFCYCEAQSFRIMSYNVENLFDTIDNPLTADDEFTPQSDRHWDTRRYWHKISQISRTIVNVGEWQHAAIVGLVEIESDTCLRDLCQRGGLRKYGYKYVHYDCQDVRGIDVALLYDPQQFRLIDQYPIPIDFGYETRPTRDILYVKGLIPYGDTLHVMVCHAPSQLGGAAATEKRHFVLRKANHVADSILTADPKALIVLMGDFNDKPERISPHIESLVNLMDTDVRSLIIYDNSARGTYVYQEQWSLLDQIFVSPNMKNRCKAKIYNADWLMQDGKPHRTYNYIRYDRTGYSDHLPVYLDIQPALISVDSIGH